MRNNFLWMSAAILTCGMMLPSCNSTDNPVAPDTPAPVTPTPVNISEESAFSDKMDLGTWCGDDFYQYAVGSWIAANPVPTKDGDKKVGMLQDWANQSIVALSLIAVKGENEVAKSLTDAYDTDDFKTDSTAVMKKVEAVEQLTTKEDVLGMMASLISQGYPCPIALVPSCIQRKIYPSLIMDVEFDLKEKEMVQMGLSADRASAIYKTAMSWENARDKLNDSGKHGRGRGYDPYANLMLVHRAETRSAGTDFVGLVAKAADIDLSTYAADKDNVDVVDMIAGYDIQTLKDLAVYCILNRDYKYLPKEELEIDALYAVTAANDQYNGLATTMSRSYVASIPSETKAEVTAIFEDIRATFRGRIGRSDWLSDATKAKAIEKLEAVKVFCGWPENFHSEWEVTTPQGNTSYEMVCDLFRQYIGLVKKLSGLDSEDALFYADWMVCPAYMANAFYAPLNNSVSLLASNLVPPIYDKTQQAFYNYAVLGTTIGHEITHGFDSNGSQFSAEGKFENWWQADDLTKYKAKQQAMIDHFSKLEYLPGVYCDGEKTLGENIADLGGLEICYEAYMNTVTATGAERERLGREFFRAFAVSWMDNSTPESILEDYKTDEHSAPKLRVNGNVCLTDAWYSLFGIRSGKMYLEPSQRITIW